MSGNGRHTSSSSSESRWRPSRSGLINFYRYDDQEFHFHQGRLLLRGNNGTGKSRVLALQLPFLLDGEISPDRVEPDGDKAKRFEWNLLMGKHDDRLGYTWIEFERAGPGGMVQHQTLGCGVRAVAGRGVVAKWFFITSRRVGHDLSLCSSQKNPLPKDSLVEVLGHDGQVFMTASAYREEVNRRLFGLPQERYEALIDLLITLRQPKLSRNLDEKTLSAAMSNSLPPVSPRMIQQVGDAMRAMEQDRVALSNLQSAQQSAEAFLLEYRRYAQIIACRRSEDVRKSHNAYEARHRKLRDAEKDHETALKEEKRLRSLDESLSLELAAAQGRKTTLESSPEMRSARDLENARKQAQDRRADADRLSGDHAKSVESLDDAMVEDQRESERLREIIGRLLSTASQSEQLAEKCGLEKPHREAALRAKLPQPDDAAMVEAADKFLRTTCDARRADSRLLRELNAAVEISRQTWRNALARRDEQAGRVSECIVGCNVSEETVVNAVSDLSQSYREWFESLAFLVPSALEDVLAAISQWGEETIVSAGPVRAAVEQALDQFRQSMAAARAAKSAELNAYQESFRLLTEEHDRLLHGEHQPPPPPYTRAASREGRAGAPLWRLCEFEENVSDNHRAALEAALESAGLLDAWINPNGEVIAPEAFDTFLGEDAISPAGPALLDVLRVSSDRDEEIASPVPAEVVRKILRRIGLGKGAGSTWVDVEGNWQVGALSGRWGKPAAQHIGQAAREAQRLRRLHELEVNMEELRQTIEGARRALDEMDERSSAAEAEGARAPSENGVRVAIAQRDAERLQLDRARLRLQEIEAALDRAKVELEAKTNHRDTTAADLGLSNWVDTVEALEYALGEYRQSLVLLWSSAHEQIRAAQSVNASKRRLDRERQRSERLGEASLDASRKAAAAESHYQTLHEMVGAAVDEVQRQLREADSLLEKITLKQKENAREIGATDERIEGLTRSLRELREEIDQETARRAAAIDRLLRFTRTALIDITDDTLAGLGRGELAVTSAVDLARRIETALARVDASDTAWAATQRAIHNHIQSLTNALQSHDYRPETITEDDTLVVTAPLHGVQRPMREFSAMLADEIVNRRSLLSAKELELLENYLIHDVAVEMGKLIREAQELVAGMNQQLQSRPNSMGMTLRFNWEPDPEGPVAFVDARRKLLGDHATWSPADRTALGQFLQEQIDRARNADVASTWHEQLSSALDYRRWHQFHVERRQDGRWVRLTRRTHGTGSGGEKAIALTIPQFAAAAAYYHSASIHAPRLILLDEAFVGIDSDMRGKCMALLHEFDLDFVMTSEREWGCYRTMPGLAVYQLSARADIDAVWASRCVWNGRERVREDPVVIKEISCPSTATELFGPDETSVSL